MADENLNLKAEKPQNQNKLMFRKWGAALTAAAAATGVGFPKSAAAEILQHHGASNLIAQNRLAKTSENQRPLKSIEKLPAYGQKTTSEQIRRLNSSTLRVLVRDSTTSNPWIEAGSAVNVSVEGQPVVAFSAHIAVGISGGYNGINIPGEGLFKGFSGPAADLIGSVPNQYEYAIAQQSAQPPFDKPAFYKLSNIAVSLEKQDLALAKIDEAQPLAEGQPPYRDIPTIPYQELSKIKPGQEFVSQGLPYDNQFQPTTAKGVFLGEINLANFTGDYNNQVFDGSYRKVYVGALRGRPGSANSCLPGASGSGALTAENQFIGELNTSVVLDKKFYAKTPANGFGYKQALAFWSDTQRQLNLKIPKDRYFALCMFADPKPGQLHNLVSAFGKYPPLLGEIPPAAVG